MIFILLQLVYHVIIIRNEFAVAKDAYVCDCMLQLVLETLIDNLPMCTHIRGLDTVFDVEACLARVAHLLNITCTSQINVNVGTLCFSQ